LENPIYTLYRPLTAESKIEIVKII
jgi:hypothetical protein